MRVTRFKPVSRYTHPAITEYEFSRMYGVERAYMIAMAVIFVLPMAGLIVLGFLSPKSAEIKSVTMKPLAHKEGQVTGDLEIDSNKGINVGSVTIR